MDKSEYRRKLEEILEDIFTEADRLRMTYRRLAAAAGLAESTVRRISCYATEYPCFRTVFKLASAVGLGLILTAIKLHNGSRRKMA